MKVKSSQNQKSKHDLSTPTLTDYFCLTMP
uniref:Uncharacterized protein n=1 Tax=Rhizophora mucronata TaxID=61149 RepID=A0A2P2PLR6_RHIMU